MLLLWGEVCWVRVFLRFFLLKVVVLLYGWQKGIGDDYEDAWMRVCWSWWLKVLMMKLVRRGEWLRRGRRTISISVLGGVLRVGVVGGRRKSKQSRSSTIMWFDDTTMLVIMMAKSSSMAGLRIMHDWGWEWYWWHWDEDWGWYWYWYLIFTCQQQHCLLKDWVWFWYWEY